MRNKRLINLKIIISYAFALLIVVSSFGFVPVTQAVGTPTLTIGSQTTSNGATINVPVNASNFANAVAGMDFSVQYDPTLLTYAGLTQNDISGHGLLIANSNVNTIIVNWFDSNALNTDNGTLLTLNFTVISAATTNANLSFTGITALSDSTGDPVTASFVDGVVYLNPAATISSIAITTPATKLIYTVGDTLDIAGLVVTGHYSDNSDQIEVITAGDVSGFDSSVPVAGQILTITFGGKIVTYTIDVVAPPDTVPPTAVSSFPADGAIGVLINVLPTLTFSEALDIATVKSGNIELREYAELAANATEVPATLILSENDTVVTFQPASALQYDKKYYFYVDSGVKDKAGNAIMATWLHADRGGHEFTTESAPIVPDTTAPVINNTPANITIEATGLLGNVVTYVAPSTSDNVDADGTATCLPASGSLFAIGSTVVTCNAVDSSGNNATPTTFNVLLQDTIAPTLSLSGESTVNIFVGALYTDAGATATDVVDGDVTASILTINLVNIAVAGTYTVTYNVSDVAGNIAAPVIRTVIVSELPIVPDTTPPVITINGSAEITLIVGESYSEQGATAVDAVDGSVTVITTGSVDINTIGDYIITYTVTDVASNTNTANRTVHVVAAPVTLTSIAITTPATKLIYTVNDVLDIAGLVITGTYSDTSAKVETITTANVSGFNSSVPVVGQVLTVTVGGHTTNYIVNVIAAPDTIAPIITLNGSAEMTITVGEPYTELGATAVDAVDGSAAVVITGSVNTNTLGNYTVTYTATDAASNISTATRTVHVVAVPVTLNSIAVTTPATKLSYTVGDVLNIAGLVITGTYSDASTKVETVTIANITGFNSSAPVVGQVLTVTVNGKTTTYTINVVAPVVPVVTPPSNSGSSGGGGGGGFSIQAPAFVTPVGGFKVAINNGAIETNSANVNLTLGGGVAVKMAISNSSDFSGISQEVYQTTRAWKLSDGLGEKTVFVKFFDKNGTVSPAVSATIKLVSVSTATSTVQTPTQAPTGQVLGVKITRTDELIAITKFGTRSNNVKLLQGELKKAGFYPKDWDLTGYYGSMTKAGVEKYKAFNKVNVAINDDVVVLGVKVVNIDNLIAITKFGTRSNNVKLLQGELKKAGFYPKDWDLTGYYGPVTKVGVEKYKASNK